MRQVRLLIDRLGTRTVALATLIPLVVALAATALTLVLVPQNYRVISPIDLTPVTRTRATYEVASYAADFAALFTGPDSVREASAASGMPEARVSLGLRTQHPGDSTLVYCTAEGPTAEAATRALRAAARTGLQHVAEQEKLRAEIEFRAAREELTRVQASFAQKNPAIPPGISLAEWRDREQDYLKEMQGQLATKRVNSVTVDIVRQSINEIVNRSSVSSTALSSVGDRLRIIATATLTSFILTAGWLYLTLTRRTKAASSNDPQGPAQSQVASAADGTPKLDDPEDSGSADYPGRTTSSRTPREPH